MFLVSICVFVMFVCTMLSHRYLLSKAEIMCNINGDSNRSSKSSVKKDTSSFKNLVTNVRHMSLTLDMLNWSFKWERRTSGVVVVAGVTLYMLGFTVAARTVGGVFTACTFVLDSTFSVLVTTVFLQPILEVLKMGMGRKSSRTKSYKRLQSSKYMTLGGTVLAVFSSSLLYTNLIFYLVWPNATGGGPPEIYHPFVFGFYLCSALNALGVLLVCGWAKQYINQSTLNGANAVWQRGKKRASKLFVPKPKVASFVFSSRTYEDDNDN